MKGHPHHPLYLRKDTVLEPFEDLRAYCEAQDRVDAAYRNHVKWNGMSLVNIARSGYFSSDRAVAEYARDIWHVNPVKFGETP